MAAAGFAAFVNIYAIQALLPTLCEFFHSSRAGVGLTISATTLAVALFSPLAGLVGSWMGRRQKVLLAMVGLVCCGLGAALAPTLNSMIGWRFAQGMFLPLLSSAIMTLDQRTPSRARWATPCPSTWPGLRWAGYAGV